MKTRELTPSRVALGALLLAALAANVGWLASLDPALTWPDEAWYLQFARGLLAEAPIAEPFRRTPGAPLFYSVILTLHDSITALRLANLVVGGVTSAVLYRIALLVYREDFTAKLAGIACFGYPFFVYLRGFVLSESLTVLALAVFAWTVLQARVRDSEALWGVSGLLASLSNLLRPVFFFMPFVIPLVLLADDEYGTRRVLRAGALLVGGWALVTSAWLGVNHQLTGKFQFTTHGSCEIYKGLAAGPGQNPSTFETPASRAACREAALDFIVENPGAALSNKLYSSVQFWSPQLDFVTDVNAGSPYQFGSYAILALLYGLALIGIWRAESRGRLVLMAVIVGYWLFHIATVVKFRYRIPVDLLLLVFAAGGVTKLLESEWRGGEAESSR